MTARVTRLSWTEAEIARLEELSSKGASVLRAAAALNRSTASVKRVATLHGLRLAGIRETKAAVRALDPEAAFAATYRRVRY
jgi:hypothetical protein